MRLEPPLTSDEEKAIADIPPEAREVFYRTVRFRWATQLLVGTFVIWFIIGLTINGIFYRVGGSMVLWWSLVAATPLTVPLFNRIKYMRTTDVGAIAKAKLAMDPDWPEWKRQRDRDEELSAIRERNPARDEEDGRLYGGVI